MKPGKVIEVRSKTLGGGTPLICTPLVGRTRERVLAEAASVVKKSPDVVEWRVDYFEGIADAAAVLDVARSLRAAAGDLPIIFTRRSIAEGGEPIAIGNEEVVELYDKVAASGLIDFLDFEMSNDAALVRRVRESAQQARHPGHPVVSQLRLHARARLSRAALPGGRTPGGGRGQGRGDATRSRRCVDASGGDGAKRMPKGAFR